MAKKVPNPNGRKGGDKHQNKVKQVEESLKDEDLLPDLEHRIFTPNGKKTKRFVDVAGLDESRSVKKLIQVGKTNKNGQAVKRERDAIEDIENATGLKVDFEDYEK